MPVVKFPEFTMLFRSQSLSRGRPGTYAILKCRKAKYVCFFLQRHHFLTKPETSDR
jgi:hypothetical protein